MHEMRVIMISVYTRRDSDTGRINILFKVTWPVNVELSFALGNVVSNPGHKTTASPSIEDGPVRTWENCSFFCHSIHFSLSVMPDSLQPHGLQHASLPFPPPTPGLC